MSFWCFQFFQKSNENNSIWGAIVVWSNFFVRVLEELKITKRHFEINWPLEQSTLRLGNAQLSWLKATCSRTNCCFLIYFIPNPWLIDLYMNIFMWFICNNFGKNFIIWVLCFVTRCNIYVLSWIYNLADLDFSLDHSICTELKKFKVKPN